MCAWQNVKIRQLDSGERYNVVLAAGFGRVQKLAVDMADSTPSMATPYQLTDTLGSCCTAQPLKGWNSTISAAQPRVSIQPTWNLSHTPKMYGVVSWANKGVSKHIAYAVILSTILITEFLHLETTDIVGRAGMNADA